MKKLQRTTLFAVVLAFGVTACGDDVQIVDPPDPPPPALTVSFSPQEVSVAVGQSVDVGLNISGGAPGATASWECSSANSAVATTTATGAGCRITGVAQGATSITANVTKGAQTASASAGVTVAELVRASVTISQINQGGLPANINNIAGQLDVVMNMNPGDETPTRLDLLVDGEVVASQEFTSSMLAELAEQMAEADDPSEQIQQITLSFNTDRYEVDWDAGTATVWHLNGEHEISAELRVLQAPADPRASNTILVVFNNEDGYAVQSFRQTNSAMDSQGRLWFGGPDSGATEITAVPVFYTGMDAQQVTVSFCGSSQSSSAAPHSFSFACANFESPAAGIEPTVSGQYSPDGDATPTGILNRMPGSFLHPEYRMPTRVDNRAPQGGAIVIATQSGLMNRENWVNGQYSFTTGYTSPTDGGVSATTFQISRVFRVHQTSDDAIILEGENTAANLDDTPTNQDYRLSVRVADVLGNARTINQTVNAAFTDVNGPAAESHSHATFGKDGEVPTLTDSEDDATVQFWMDSFDLASQDMVSGFAAPATGEGLRHSFIRVRGTPNQPTNLNRENIVGSGSISSTPFATSEVPAFVNTPAGVKTYVRTPTQLEYTQAIDLSLDVPAYYIYQAQARDKGGNLSPMFVARAYQNAEADPEITGLTPATFYSGGEQISFAAVASDPVELISASFDLRYANTGRIVFDRNPDVLGVKFTDMITRPFGFDQVYRATFADANILSGFIRSMELTDAFGRPDGALNKPNQAQSRVYNGYSTETDVVHMDADVLDTDGASPHFAAPIIGDAVEDGVAFPAGTAAADPQAIGPTDVDDTQAGDGGSLGFVYSPTGAANNILARGITAQFLRPFDHVVVFGRVDSGMGAAEDWLVPLGRASQAGSLDNGVHRDFYWTFNFPTADYSEFTVVGVSSAFDGLVAANVAGIDNSLVIVAPSGGTATLDQGATVDLVVELRDLFGNVIPGETITFTVSDPDGTGSTIDPASDDTDGSGQATTEFTAGAGNAAGGTVEVTADHPSATAVVFTITVNAANQ